LFEDRPARFYDGQFAARAQPTTDAEVRRVLEEAYALLGRKKAYRVQAESTESDM
jgi:hypothetical protein